MRKTLAFLAAAAFLLTSCQKELCYNHPHGFDNTHGKLKVSFLWDDVVNASPTEMHLVAFSGGKNPVIYPLGGMSGGDVSLWGGNYWFVAYNSDTETVTTRGETFDEYEICGIQRDLTKYVKGFEAHAKSFSYLGARSTKADDSTYPDGTTFIWEPEQIWVSTESDITVTPGSEQEVPMRMWNATYQYTFLIRNVENLNRVATINASLSGLASCYRPSEHCARDYNASEIFSFTIVDETSIRGQLRVFGHSPEEEEGGQGTVTVPEEIPNTLTLYVTMDNGNRYGYQFDVTEDMANPTFSTIDTQTGEIVINIRIEDIPIPDQPSEPASGFDIGIDDFITEEWDIFP